jgi:hypothetical protein
MMHLHIVVQVNLLGIFASSLQFGNRNALGGQKKLLKFSLAHERPVSGYRCEGKAKKLFGVTVANDEFFRRTLEQRRN